MTALSSLIDRSIHRLNGTRTPIVSTTSGAMGIGVTSLPLTYDRTSIVPGAVVEFADGEQALVMAGTVSPYTVIRGVHGTTEAVQASGQLVTIGPRWPRQRVLEYAIEEIWSWPDELGAILRIDVTGDSASDVVEIPDIANRQINRLGYVYVKDGLGRDWQQVDATIVRSDDFASGWGLKMNRRLNEAMQVEVLTVPEKSSLGPSSNLVTLGYEQSMEDILLLGIMQRCLAFAEASRSDGAGYEAARNEANPPTAMTQNAEYYATMRSRRLADEIYRVHSRMPILRTSMS